MVVIGLGVVWYEEFFWVIVGVLMIDVVLWMGVSGVWGRVGWGIDGGISDDWWMDFGVFDCGFVKYKFFLLY